MTMRWFYKCPQCGKEYEIVPGRYLCDACAKRQLPDRPLEGILEVEWEGEMPHRWEGESHTVPYPVEEEWFPPIPVGHTPLWKPARLRKDLDAPNLWIKDDTRNPSGSLKDRASFLVAAFALKHKLKEIVLASTGNAASSMAAIGAASGLSIKVFLPEKAPVAKRIQVLQYGAELVPVDGTYDRAFDLSREYSDGTGSLSRNTAYNPLTIEGKKSVAYEIVHDLLREGANNPDHIFVPTGDGVILSGVYRGLENLVRLGRMKHMPTVWACQAEGSSGIARAFASGKEGAAAFAEVRQSNTIADSISVDVPRNGIHALSKLRKHGGKTVTVSDGEILMAQRILSAGAGLFAEPSSAAAFAGWHKVSATLGKNETIVILITGSGLKDVKSAALGLGLNE